MSNIPARRLAMGIIGLAALSAIALFFAVVVDHFRHIVPVAFALLIFWIAYFYALSRKAAK